MKKPKQAYAIDSTVSRRLAALEMLIDDSYEGSAAVFEQRTGVRMAQVSQWFTGYRALRDKALRRLEEKTRKPLGWFDADRSAAAVVQPGQPPAPDRREPQPNLTPDAAYVVYWLTKVKDRETRERLAHACVTLIVREIDGPASSPTQEPAPQTETPSSARRAR